MHLIQSPQTSLEVIEDSHPKLSLSTLTGEIFADLPLGSEVIRKVSWDFSDYRYAVKNYEVPLETMLAEADGYFNDLSTVIGGSVLPHDWVVLVAERPHDIRPSRRDEFLQYLTGLTGNIFLALGVKVEKISGISITEPQQGIPYKPSHAEMVGQANYGLRAFDIGHQKRHGWGISDVQCVRQFMTVDGMSTLDNAKTIEECDPILVDVEPMFISNLG